MVDECHAIMQDVLHTRRRKVSDFQWRQILMKGMSWPPSLSKTQDPTRTEFEVQHLSSAFLVTSKTAFAIAHR